VEQLGQLWPELDVIAEAADGIQALRLLEEHRPDVLFLDINMPGATGMEVARQANGRARVVFVTAYDEHAVPRSSMVRSTMCSSRFLPRAVHHREPVEGKAWHTAGTAGCRARSDHTTGTGGAATCAGSTRRWTTFAPDHGRRDRYFQADNKYAVVTSDAEASDLVGP